MVKVAIDIDETISRHPDEYRELMAALMGGGAFVHVVTGRGDLDGRSLQLERVGILKGEHYDSIEVVNDGSAEPAELAQIKARRFVELGVTVVLDDMPEVVIAARELGLLPLQSL